MKRLKFRLWHLFTATIFVALVIACFVAPSSKNARATKKLREAGASVSEEFVDPIGPNSLYPRLYNSEFRTPSPGTFSNWFESVFCIRGFSHFSFKNKSLDKSDLQQFHKLLHLHRVDFDNCEFRCEGTIATFSECPNLFRLSLNRVNLSSHDIEALRNLTQIDFLDFTAINFGSQAQELSKSVSVLQNLKYLAFEECDLSFEEVEALRQNLPNCEVAYFPQEREGTEKVSKGRKRCQQGTEKVSARDGKGVRD